MNLKQLNTWTQGYYKQIIENEVYLPLVMPYFDETFLFIGPKENLYFFKFPGDVNVFNIVKSRLKIKTYMGVQYFWLRSDYALPNLKQMCVAEEFEYILSLVPINLLDPDHVVYHSESKQSADKHIRWDKVKESLEIPKDWQYPDGLLPEHKFCSLTSILRNLYEKSFGVTKVELANRLTEEYEKQIYTKLDVDPVHPKFMAELREKLRQLQEQEKTMEEIVAEFNLEICEIDEQVTKTPAEIVDKIWSNLNWKEINAMAMNPRDKCCEVFDCPGKCASVAPDKVLGYLTSDGKYVATEDEFIMSENVTP